MDYKKYMTDFEKEVICRGFMDNVFGKRCEEIVPLRFGKMSETQFGSFMGKTFVFNKVLAINYYGYFKLSSQIIVIKNQASKIFGELRSIKSPVVHFNSIRIEDVKSFAPQLFDDFLEFKKYIVGLRWEKKK